MSASQDTMINNLQKKHYNFHAQRIELCLSLFEDSYEKKKKTNLNETRDAYL